VSSIPSPNDNTYLITPVGVLGADSFHVKALTVDGAVAQAKILIRDAGFHMPNGWEVYKKLPSNFFLDATERFKR